jgi:hypothetical protein
MFWSSVLEIVFKRKGGSVILMHLALVGGLHCKDASYCLETYMIWDCGILTAIDVLTDILGHGSQKVQL